MTHEDKQALQASIKEQAKNKGLEVYFSANVGLVKGSSRQTVITVYGNTFSIKDTLKAFGAVWNGKNRCWVFEKTEDFQNALSAI